MFRKLSPVQINPEDQDEYIKKIGLAEYEKYIIKDENIKPKNIKRMKNKKDKEI
jgi:hypothetical protein